jgi:hypothetical protein
MRKFRSIIIILLVVTMISTLGFPVSAWSDIGEEYVDYRDIQDGTWDTNTWTATEDDPSSCSFLGYLEIWYVDTDADVYKVRVEYNTWWAETLTISYRWGSGSFTDICDCGWFPGYAEYTITDATSSILELRLQDANPSNDILQDSWDFECEMYLIMYWY